MSVSERAIYDSPLGSSMDSRKAWRSQDSVEKTKKGGNKKSCMSQVKEYNSETSLHGPKYITEDGNFPPER